MRRARARKLSGRPTDDIVVGGFGIVIGALLVRFAFATTEAAVVDDEGVDAEVVEDGELFQTVRNVSRISVEEEDGQFCIGSRYQPSIDVHAIGGGEGDVFVF